MKEFVVYSDRGGAVHFGSDEKGFNCLYFPTSFGDGKIEVIVCSGEEYTEIFEKKDDSGKFFGVLNGRFHLYGDDCGTDILATLEGEFYLYDQMDPYKPRLVMASSRTKGGKVVYEATDGQLRVLGYRSISLYPHKLLEAKVEANDHGDIVYFYLRNGEVDSVEELMCLSKSIEDIQDENLYHVDQSYFTKKEKQTLFAAMKQAM